MRSARLFTGLVIALSVTALAEETGLKTPEWVARSKGLVFTGSSGDILDTAIQTDNIRPPAAARYADPTDAKSAPADVEYTLWFRFPKAGVQVGSTDKYGTVSYRQPAMTPFDLAKAMSVRTYGWCDEARVATGTTQFFEGIGGKVIAEKAAYPAASQPATVAYIKNALAEACKTLRSPAHDVVKPLQFGVVESQDPNDPAVKRAKEMGRNWARSQESDRQYDAHRAKLAENLAAMAKLPIGSEDSCHRGDEETRSAYNGITANLDPASVEVNCQFGGRIDVGGLNAAGWLIVTKTREPQGAVRDYFIRKARK